MPMVTSSLAINTDAIDPDIIDDFAEEFLELFLDRVVARTPVRTGLLQASWGGEIVGDTIVIENPVEYASYVEYGTPKMEPRAMLRTTILEADQIARQALRNVKK